MIKCLKAQAAIMPTSRGRSVELVMVMCNAGDAINQEKTPAHSKGNKATKVSKPASW
jgi:hypothetical protein